MRKNDTITFEIGRNDLEVVLGNLSLTIAKMEKTQEALKGVVEVIRTALWEDDDPDDEIVQLYSIEPIAAGEALTAVEEMGVDSQIAKMVKQTYTKEGKTTTITTIYEYDGFYIGLDVDVDAVQTHNAEDAILSAWGVNAAGADDGAITGIN